MGYDNGYEGIGMMGGYGHGGFLFGIITMVLVWVLLVLGGMALWKYLRNGKDEKKDK
ncbi:MAG: hypothetical protein ACYC8S_02460 [Minisyncoccota bacterium]